MSRASARLNASRRAPVSGWVGTRSLTNGSDSSAGESLAGRRGNSNLGASGGLRHRDVSELAHKATQRERRDSKSRSLKLVPGGRGDRFPFCN
jgi:hypothetical protein